jgi:hypothetical protein
MTMIINDVIMQNEKLASQMKAYAHEIEKLNRLRDMIRKKSSPKNQYAHLLSVRLNVPIASAIREFEWINDNYDQKTHDCEEVKSNEGRGFINIAQGGCERLQNKFSELKNSKIKTHRTVVEYCHLIDNE